MICYADLAFSVFVFYQLLYLTYPCFSILIDLNIFLIHIFLWLHDVDTPEFVHVFCTTAGLCTIVTTMYLIID